PENVMLTDLGAVKLIGFVVDGVLHGAAHPGPHDPGGDVRNLAGLLYAALTGRWPGSPASAVPEAPVENGVVLRPRQVRAGVPRPLDALCDEVLNIGEADQEATASGIQRRLGEFLGDVVTGADLDDQTAVLDVRSVREALSGDPEATQAMRFGGSPEDTADSGAGSGSGTDTGAQQPRPPAPAAPALRPSTRPSAGPRPGMGAGAPPADWGPDASGD